MEKGALVVCAEAMRKVSLEDMVDILSALALALDMEPSAAEDADSVSGIDMGNKAPAGEGGARMGKGHSVQAFHSGKELLVAPVISGGVDSWLEPPRGGLGKVGGPSEPSVA